MYELFTVVDRMAIDERHSAFFYTLLKKSQSRLERIGGTCFVFFFSFFRPRFVTKEELSCGNIWEESWARNDFLKRLSRWFPLSHINYKFFFTSTLLCNSFFPTFPSFFTVNCKLSLPLCMLFGSAKFFYVLLEKKKSISRERINLQFPLLLSFSFSLSHISFVIFI